MQELSTGPVDWSAVETGEEISHHKPGVQRRVLGACGEGTGALKTRLTCTR